MKKSHSISGGAALLAIAATFAYCTQMQAQDPEYFSSFEDSTDGWAELPPGQNIYAGNPTSVDVAGGAPVGAITDGEYALRITANPSGAWSLLSRLNTTFELVEAFHFHNTIEMDVYIAEDAIEEGKFSSLGFNLNHQEDDFAGTGGFMTTFRDLTPSETGAPYHFKWRYADEAMYNPDAIWTQFQMISVAENPRGGTVPIPEFYVDNFRFTTTDATESADLNSDGFVDGLDLGILLGNFEQGAPPSGGELDGSAPVDGLDLGILLGAWNPPEGLAAATIPEPTSAALCLMGGVLVAARRRESSATGR